MEWEYFSDLVRILSEEANLKAAYLFGSATDGKMRPDSDVDVAVWMEGPLDPQTKALLIKRIASICLRPVDLLDLRKTDPVLLEEILSTGKPLIEPPVDVLESLLQMIVRNEADFLPLLRRARRERVEAFASE